MLDFGSGSGILSIAAVKLGATAVAIEIDSVAQAHARANADANHAGERIELRSAFDGAAEVFDLVVANILRDVLIAFRGDIVRRLAREGTLVLSGLVSTDVPILVAHYGPHFEGRRPDIYERGEWRALVWRRTGRSVE
jgi:ribosomal protein L11 methyltransferase